MTRTPSTVLRAPKCPACKTKTTRVVLAGKQAVCINSKCLVTKFTVKKFDKPGAPIYVKKNPNKPGKSFNNSGRTVTPRKKKHEEE